MEQMVKNMVRLALACEYSRTPIRRQDISTKVLGNQSRQFKAVFNAAQLQLRAVFGMEMTEMPIAEKVTVAQRRAAARSQNSQKSSGAWQLISTLPERFHTPAILAPPQVPTSEEESQYTALYTVVVALIALSGGNLSETKLERYMRRFNIDEYTPFANSNAFSEYDKPEKLLRRMERDRYVVKAKDSSGVKRW
ncbi:hypothetical protein H2203_007857 [Taxawa tesnikishii (nom. ined.)]|nr:hypothetical protein H2203_007857 [Dothideales sp. JES 119]